MTGPSEYLASLFALSGDVAFVTGGGSGIGRACALGMARAGATLVIGDKDLPAAEGVAKEITAAGGRALALELEVASKPSVEAAVQRALATFEKIDILLNNAGISSRRPTEDLSLEDWQRVFDVNVTGMFLCAQAVGRHMIGRGSGRIINVASIMGFVGNAVYPALAYNSAKGAVVNFTRTLAVEWARYGIRVNGVAPTYIRSNLTRPLMEGPELVQHLVDLTPLGRIGDPDDIVGGVLYLASRASGLVTGHTLAIDGGWLAR